MSDIMPSSEPELKSCPFCEYEHPEIKRDGTVEVVYVSCSCCGASSGYDHEADPTDKWNRRSPQTAVEVDWGKVREGFEHARCFTELPMPHVTADGWAEIQRLVALHRKPAATKETR